MALIGRVIKGEQKAGKLYGVPTANLVFATPFELEFGVYTAFASLADGSTYPSVVCFRAPQTFEVHLFGFVGDLYGQEVEVDVEEKISEIAPFTNEENMKAKVLADVALAREIFLSA